MTNTNTAAAYLEKLAKGEVNIWDVDAKKTLPSALNGVLRIYYNNKQPGINVVSLASLGPVTDEWEVDHFLEIQHIVAILMKLHPQEDYKILSYPVGDFLRLSAFLNTTYNLFKIPKVWNQKKKTIDFNLYDTHTKHVINNDNDKFIQEYLFSEVKTSDGMRSNVKTLVWGLVGALEKARGNNSDLCLAAGAALRLVLSGYGA